VNFRKNNNMIFPSRFIKILIICFRKLTELKLERRTDYKAMKLHPYEIASLSNLVKDVSLKNFQLGILIIGIIPSSIGGLYGRRNCQLNS
jgi:hypothetical protein